LASAASTTRPPFTVVVSPREGHLAAVESLVSVLADDVLPFELIYLDIMSPPDVAAAVRRLCAGRGFEVIRFDDWTPPAAARKLAAQRVRTPYVVFVDNDVIVERSCFARLLACAEETGAGLVGGLYLEGPPEAPVIHMAGGEIARDEAGAMLSEHHVYGKAPVAEAGALVRRQVDYMEGHAFLLRTDLARSPGVISDDVLLAAEHIDISLAVRALGQEVWFEPDARIFLKVLFPPRLGDLDFFARRWDPARCDLDLEAFCRRWPVAAPERFFEGLRGFHGRRWAQARVCHPTARRERADQPMTAAELAQSRTGLREQAAAHGYGAAHIRAIEAACDYATLLCDGLYRADGRPFLNHLIGTASALVRYELRHDVVLAGLLHSAYTHQPPWFDPAEISRILASGGATDDIVRAIPAAKARLATGDCAGTLTLEETWPLLVEAANETDMLLSGEYRASGRPPEIGSHGLDLLAEATRLVGAGGLGLSARTPRGEGHQTALLGQEPPFHSFRLDARHRRLGPATAGK